jgi:hypothetical protein
MISLQMYGAESEQKANVLQTTSCLMLAKPIRSFYSFSGVIKVNK